MRHTRRVIEFFKSRDRYKVVAGPVAKYTIRTYCIIQIAYSIALIAGGRQRWSLETYQVISQIPGTPASFAIWLTLAAAMVLAMSFLALRYPWSGKVKDWAWVVMIVWWLTYAVCLAGAITPWNHVPFASPIAAFGNAFLVGWLSMIDERKPLDDAIAFSGFQRGIPAPKAEGLTALEETLRVLDDSARSVPLLPSGAERGERVSDPALPSEPDSDRVR